jgi:hypothetical protein
VIRKPRTIVSNQTQSRSEDSAVAVLIHPSQFPHAVEAAFRESLRSRQMNHKFHYDTPKQTLRWMRVHETFSPARQDPSCVNAYQELAAVLATALAGETAVEIVSLGCGGGQKGAVNPGSARSKSVPVAAVRACRQQHRVDFAGAGRSGGGWGGARTMRAVRRGSGLGFRLAAGNGLDPAAWPAARGLPLRHVAQLPTRFGVVEYGGMAWRFTAGDRFQLFYSYRHTLASVASLLGLHGIQIACSWTNAAGAEGVFLGQRT